MNSGSDADDSFPAELPEVPNLTSKNSLSERSKRQYEAAYKAFMDWKTRKKVDTFSEKVFLAYFHDLSKVYRATSLWAFYSMLRNTMNVRHNVDFDHYKSLHAFLKSNARGYKAEGCKVFNIYQIDKFLKEAPDEKYLVTKVAFIMGLMGSCRTTELYAMRINDLQDFGAAFLVRIPNNKSKVIRKFVVTDKFYHICKKYVSLRPSNVATDAFFLSYNNGKCGAQRIGINRFGFMGKQIALYLKLPNPEMYNGRCFRKSKGVQFDGTEVTLSDFKNSLELQKLNPAVTDMQASSNTFTNSVGSYMESANNICQSGLISNDSANSAGDPLDTETLLLESENNFSNDFFHTEENESKETDSDVECKFVPDRPDFVETDTMWEENMNPQNETTEENNDAIRPKIRSYNEPKNISDMDDKIKAKQLQLIQNELEQNQKLFELKLEKYQLEKEIFSVQLQKLKNEEKLSEIELQLKQKEFESRMRNS